MHLNLTIFYTYFYTHLFFIFLFFNQQIPVALIVSESWTDSRLNISHWDKGKVVFHENMIHLFWTPKLYLVSTEGMKQDKFTQKIIVKPNGDIMLLQRLVMFFFISFFFLNRYLLNTIFL